jgi:uncharacterized protein (DUF433 family)
MDLFARISIDPAVRFGKPCVRGTRLTVGDVLGTLAAGSTEAQHPEAGFLLIRPDPTAAADGPEL